MNRSSYRRSIALALAACLGAGAAHAQSQSELVDLIEALRENRALNSGQYQELRRKALRAAADAANERNARLRLERQARLETQGGFKLESADGDFEFEIGGELWLDSAYYEPDQAPLGNGTELRRARLSLGGRVFDDWSYAAEYDFAGNEAEVKDVYLQYDFDEWAIRIGHFKEPFSMSDQTSGKANLFMERPQPVDVFAPGRKLGIGVLSGGKRWSLAAGLFGEAADADVDDEGDEGWGVSGRASVAPVNKNRHVLHLGASLAYRRPDDDKEVRYRAGLETHVSGEDFLDTGRIRDVENTAQAGLEGAWAMGPVSLEGEYLLTTVSRGGGAAELNLSGGYVQLSWVLTGESRPYKGSRGRFNRIEPKGKRTAWELAVRYSILDLADADVTGGEASNLTLGLNAYLNSNVRFRANLVEMDANPDEDGGRQRPKAFQVRAEVYF